MKIITRFAGPLVSMRASVSYCFTLDTRTTAPSKTQVNPRSFHGLQCPDGPFPARRDILACLRVCKKIRGSIQWPRFARVLRAATVRERFVVVPTGDMGDTLDRRHR